MPQTILISKMLTTQLKRSNVAIGIEELSLEAIQNNLHLLLDIQDQEADTLLLAYACSKLINNSNNNLSCYNSINQFIAPLDIHRLRWRVQNIPDYQTKMAAEGAAAEQIALVSHYCLPAGVNLDRLTHPELQKAKEQYPPYFTCVDIYEKTKEDSPEINFLRQIILSDTHCAYNLKLDFMRKFHLFPTELQDNILQHTDFKKFFSLSNLKKTAQAYLSTVSQQAVTGIALFDDAHIEKILDDPALASQAAEFAKKFIIVFSNYPEYLNYFQKLYAKIRVQTFLKDPQIQPFTFQDARMTLLGQIARQLPKMVGQNQIDLAETISCVENIIGGP